MNHRSDDVRRTRSSSPMPGEAAFRSAEERSFGPTREREDPPAALVVAAGEATRAAAGGVLHSAGFAVTYAVDGPEGVMLACSEPFDLILMHAALPFLDGLEATRRIRRLERRRRAPRSHLIVVSEEGAEQDRSLAFEAGADGQVTNPIEPRLIMTAALQVLRRQQASALA
jgi:two-component system, sensor histidine kinase and response regulator